MHYVVLELEVEHKIETPKDHSRVSKIMYQIINESDLLCAFPTSSDTNELPSIMINNEANAFQEAISNLDTIIKNYIKDDTFVLCSLFSTWHIRVTMQREARDLDYELPIYLAHPVIFDLKKEYLRWIKNHKDLLPVMKSSVNETATSTEEENEVESEQDIKKDDRMENQDTLISEIMTVMKLDMPHNMIDIDIVNKVNIIVTVELLKKLHKMCESDEDKQNVLTQPYDSLTDYNTFLERQSTTLYVNNLPQDTTQSELESWFSQFGSRPIGFWTIKKKIAKDNNDENRRYLLNNCPYIEEPDSISGFIIFQNKEEAKEALLLNGRSVLSNVANIKQPRVVEHVVEIEPSCSSVLVKAHDILTSFPQSKNKPRPGDWTCPSCGFSNFQRRTACFRCTFPIPSNLASTKTNHNIHRHNNNSSNNGNYSNENNNLNNVATNSNTSTEEVLDNNMNNNNNRSNNFNNTGHVNRYIHHNGSSTQNNGSNVPFRAGDWKCTACQYHNFAKNVMCLRCNKPKIRQSNTNNNNNGNNTAVNGNNESRLWDNQTHGNNYLTQDQNRYNNNSSYNNNSNVNSRNRIATVKPEKIH
ncbi:hypothetical protein C6P45_004622 [Maudiozyma exigua]|uniref:Asparagine-rich protein n=1 Tax=Maudiozyma exigua TaxID=34358 RepID=A0A9P6WBM2_MAUEX|nr:hypothetical protein C6P45_004622 [Kazachstania exigua]